jgi:hypothetical protein
LIWPIRMNHRIRSEGNYGLGLALIVFKTLAHITTNARSALR